MKTVCEVLGVSRSNLAVKLKRPAEWGDRRKTPALDDMPLVTELQALVASRLGDVLQHPHALQHLLSARL
ncbi:integrase catalytic subunit [Burkholderia sola]|nr:integrase catalytic subunit [Burkholderia cenocepacia]CAG2304878.1 integrase catalytic subunit [Burkholderia cenocepacia]CAG2304880.1 integrase catalytic subunit [Burkholderia cenocepacia]CAG2304891.1 integrase catalytic subunit [Burkholderia cenocepacia]CAG2304899.1 integrase catalytic subunit [Burkholderia cenocepacia]